MTRPWTHLTSSARIAATLLALSLAALAGPIGCVTAAATERVADAPMDSASGDEIAVAAAPAPAGGVDPADAASSTADEAPVPATEAERTPSRQDATSAPREPAPGARGSSAAPVDGQHLRVIFIDVGQGDGTLFITPSGRTMLVDAGPNEAGERIVALLKALGIRKIDLFVWTHPHLDHIGGAMDVLRAVEVGAVVDSQFDHPSATYSKLLAEVEGRAKAGKLKYFRGYVGRRVHLDPTVEIEMLGPPKEAFMMHSRSNVNANSVILRVSFGKQSILMTGDSEEETESYLLQHRESVDVDVLKVAHHGSDYASGRAFVSAVSPQIAVVSCGAKNRYGHPSQATLARIASTGAKIFRTDREGSILLELDGVGGIEVTPGYAADASPAGSARRSPSRGRRAHADAEPGPAPGADGSGEGAAEPASAMP